MKKIGLFLLFIAVSVSLFSQSVKSLKEENAQLKETIRLLKAELLSCDRDYTTLANSVKATKAVSDTRVVSVSAPAASTKSNSVNEASSANAYTGSAGTVYVNGYLRKDGTYVAPYTRSAPNSGNAKVSQTPSSSGGTVYVNGYYRKDGTYVRPHTRRAPSR